MVKPAPTRILLGTLKQIVSRKQKSCTQHHVRRKVLTAVKTRVLCVRFLPINRLSPQKTNAIILTHINSGRLCRERRILGKSVRNVRIGHNVFLQQSEAGVVTNFGEVYLSGWQRPPRWRDYDAREDGGFVQRNLVITKRLSTLIYRALT